MVTEPPPSEDDLDLFRLFANGETRRVLEALLRRELTQAQLCERLKVTQGTMGPAIGKLETAGLISRPSPRGELRLCRFDQTADLLEAEAKLADEILADKKERAGRRLRRIRKDRMSAGAKHGKASSG